MLNIFFTHPPSSFFSIEMLTSVYSTSSLLSISAVEAYRLRSRAFCVVSLNSSETLSRVSGAVCFSSSSVSCILPSNSNGVRLEEIVSTESLKTRLDSWISSRLHGVSRARVQSTIRSGLVLLNGKVANKASQMIKSGDKVDCTICELKPLKAEPENIPLDVVYEDDYLLVVNKPPHMVVHPAPGNTSKTLVNAVLHHCSLPGVSCYEEEEESDAEGSLNTPPSFSSSKFGDPVRPGIVHRLDKGTSGLIIVAKTEQSHSHLAEQFEKHSIHRIYLSLTSGMPVPESGQVDIPIGRDLNNRVRMAAVCGPSCLQKIRQASSRYKLLEELACGGSALVEWRLGTGRTHQIRVHAKYLGVPLLGDEMYGCSKNRAISLILSRLSSACHPQLSQLVSTLSRPCLHAAAIGFIHPVSEERLCFSCKPPEDFSQILDVLRNAV